MFTNICIFIAITKNATPSRQQIQQAEYDEIKFYFFHPLKPCGGYLSVRYIEFHTQFLDLLFISHTKKIMYFHWDKFFKQQ